MSNDVAEIEEFGKRWVKAELDGDTGAMDSLAHNDFLLVGPLGFAIDDRQLQRAGLDYWKEVDLRFWNSFAELRAAQVSARYFFLTTKTSRLYYDVTFRPGDFLVFGRETKGLAESLLAENAEQLLTIPMHGTRSLNLATAVAIVLFEAVRQNTSGS